MVVILKSASRNDRSGLLQMLRNNGPKVSKKDKKESKEVSKENKGKEGNKK